MSTKNQSSQGAGTSTSRTTESRQWQQTTDYLTDRQAGRQTFGENKPNGWIAILAAFAFRYFPISSNNRNRAKPYRKFCEFLLNSCGKSHPLAHKFHAQLAISFGFSFFFFTFLLPGLSRDLFCFRALVYCVFAARIEKKSEKSGSSNSGSNNARIPPAAPTFGAQPHASSTHGSLLTLQLWGISLFSFAGQRENVNLH